MSSGMWQREVSECGSMGRCHALKMLVVLPAPENDDPPFAEVGHPSGWGSKSASIK
jgi:hypothetical protein